MTDIEQVRRVPVLRGLSEAALAELARRSSNLAFRAGDTIFRAGDDFRGVFAVLSGEVRVVRSSLGRQHLVHPELPGGLLGEVPAFDGGGYPATAVAAVETECLLIPRDAIDATIRIDPAFSRLFLSRLAARVRALVERLDRMVAASVRQRLAARLLDLAAASPGGPFELGCSQEQLAEELGTVREVVVRELGVLRRRGLIARVGQGKYAVADPEGLAAVITGGPPR